MSRCNSVVFGCDNELIWWFLVRRIEVVVLSRGLSWARSGQDRLSIFWC
ncbi:unnamed protein product [Arabidopsis lyrata]|nr:unnamed protein product [Arabidopsis lyrata]